MDEHQTQVLLEELDAVRAELSQLRAEDTPGHRLEGTARRLLPVVFALVAGLTAWYAVRVAIADQSNAPTVAVPSVRMTPVVTTRLEPGTVIRSEDLGHTQ